MPAEYEQSAERGPSSAPPRESAGDAVEPALLPPGNPWRPRALLVALPAALALLLMMAADRHFDGLAVPLGALWLLLAGYGILDALGTFDSKGPVVASCSSRELALPAFACATVSLGLVASVRLAVAGVLPFPKLLSGLSITALSLALVCCGYWLVFKLAGHAERPLYRREGFWLLVLAIVLYVPSLGSFSLIDPWETHYGEVAREMLARDDWISFWWAQEGWFWSKPALDFWLQGLSFLLFGVNYRPDRMLAAASDGGFPQPEWAARLPGVLLTLIATYLAYKALARVAGRRAGLLGGVVLVTAPYWFLLSHQSTTDMPYVAPLTAALSLVLLGLHTDPQAELSLYELRVGARRLRLSLAHGVLLLVIVTALPQLLYLASRNVTLGLSAEPLLSLHADRFFSGSGLGNCGLPGNEACERAAPVNALFQPAVGALVWGVLFALFLWVNRGERRQQRWLFLAAWYFASLSVLAKGAPGLVLALVITLLGVCASKRFRELGRLELAGFGLLLCVVALPWYVQAFMRHGSAFSDRLLFYDMYKRAFVHVHDTNAGDDTSFRYYVWQLGYGLFPWTGLCVAGLVSAFSGRDEAENRQANLRSFLVLWFLVAFCLFSVSLTKFHHYVLPAVPPAALLCGLVLEPALGRRDRLSDARRLLRAFSATLAAACAVSAAIVLGRGSLLGNAPPPAGSVGTSLLLACTLLLAATAAFLACLRLSVQRAEAEELAADSRFRSATLGLFGLFAAGIVMLVGRDLYTQGAVDGQARLLHLFSYNYARPWPSSLDVAAVLRGFTVVAASALGLALVPRLRAAAARTLIATAALFTAFGLSIYLVQLAPHYGQRETVFAYYATRAGPEEPLVAYQMNWKGENFYTGNRLPAFVSSGAKFKAWIQEQKDAGTRVLYLMTEHSRLGTLKNELGRVNSFQVLTKPEMNNKFFLARVVL